MKVHIEIACVHGSNPKIFLAHEHLASDPNMTCEVLYRTLLSEQEKRGGLPPTLYLQLDNCIRENKNTVFFCYLAWLLERGIFDHIYVSFLPVGHTHFDCDQLASRIAFALKYRNVTSFTALMELIKQCNAPEPEVEVIDAVIDIKNLFNPSGKPEFPVSTSRVRRCNGCCTKVIPSNKRQFFMQDTSPLHWYICRDRVGKVFIQSKLIADDEQWSQQHYPWTPNAPRPNDRDFEEHTSGLRPSDLRMAPQKMPCPTRIKELAKSIPGVRFRLTSEEDWQATKAAWEDLLVDRRLDRLPVPNNGLFIGEEDVRAPRVPDRDPANLESTRLCLRPWNRIFINTHQQALDRANRKARGRAKAELIVGNMIAHTVDYADDWEESLKQAFFVGRIIELDHETREVNVQQFHTAVLKNATSNRAKYAPWVGDGTDNTNGWIDISRVLHTFTLTDGGLVPAMDRRQIVHALNLPDWEDPLHPAVDSDASGNDDPAVDSDASGNDDL